ncbi:MAG: MerR family transcriptional regulator [Sandaracinaceae bacterium]|nr:MerR family transcriptional regulator [Sandaracinaceae bacterium]
MGELAVAGLAPDPHPYRMKDLCELSGLGRQAIHFYIQQGLLPQGHKTGRNMAWYGEEHLERLKLIKRLQHERFLPLKAIKAVLDDQQSAFSETQRGFLIGVKQHLAAGLDDAPGLTVDAQELAARLGLERADVERMVELELVGGRTDDEGGLAIRQEDVWLVEAWAEVKRLGLTEALALTPADLRMYDEVVTELLTRETQLLASRLPAIPEARAAELIEKVLPVVHSILTGMHHAKIRNFLASIG